eukprot:3016871-Rhodomonas_salina.1
MDRRMATGFSTGHRVVPHAVSVPGISQLTDTTVTVHQNLRPYRSLGTTLTRSSPISAITVAPGSTLRQRSAPGVKWGTHHGSTISCVSAR